MGDIKVHELRYPCSKCPLRALSVFRDLDDGELQFISKFKRGELAVERGATVLVEGNHSAHLYTLLSGLAFRYKLLHDGRRQILNYAMPGDLLGLQAGLLGEMQHSVEALSPLLLCVFERERVFDLFKNHPGLSYDITWIAAREEQMLDENLLSVGRRSAVERAAYLLSFLYARLQRTKAAFGAFRVLPITQQHVADTLGLSLVHTNKTLRKLAQRGLLSWREGGCEIKDAEGLLATARWAGLAETRRALI
ncbi:MAG: Crp/Fnr family transcriptional regulator [Rhizobiaceae bacterium]|nr:Crp/Fnr family transcriptional regulator [Rhizobiaceae bacterium]